VKKHAKRTGVNPHDDRCQRKKYQGGQHGTNRRSRCRLSDGHTFLFHKIDLNDTATGGEGGNIGYEDIDENEFKNKRKRDAKPHRPYNAIQSQSVRQIIKDQKQRQGTDDVSGKQFRRYSQPPL